LESQKYNRFKQNRLAPFLFWQLSMIIRVTVKPNSEEEAIEKVSDCQYFLKVKEPAEKGKANAAVVNLLQKYFKKRVRIIRGFSDRDKIIEIN
jgi:uncharacterized protein (TIGR00251 family)